MSETGGGPAVPAGLAVVVPIYDEQEVLAELWRRLASTLDGMRGLAWRVVFVDDGSRDGSLSLLRDLEATEPRVEIVELSRNFGHQAALAAGLEAALEGTEVAAVVLMDGDLQDPPEVIPALVEAWRTGAEVVHARRRSRGERAPRRWFLQAFHRLFGWLSDFPVPPRSGIFGLLDRQAATELARLTESHRYLPGLRGWIGFREATVEYDREARAAGQPKQDFARLLRYGTDAVLSFSFKPLRLMTLAGVVISAFGFALAALFVVKRLLGIEPAETGFTTLVTLILFLGGVQLIAIGLLGEYVGRIYEESKRRPLYIVRRRERGRRRVAPPGPR